eukprot:CAMPEP_0171638374 /NCGR_PEP_ID=MMETSP0990-20121206/28905_1 /TAXON_ID=483369 /ORGANISM="non described non described, Strain CCMP2098" /LENGTH=97 /DNA_ID=CAMNT_0012211559 /DNA_START=49 /DNA_END=339 /DNA_ORIENTATION=-
MWSGVSPYPSTTVRSASLEIRSNASAVTPGYGRLFLLSSSVLSFSPSGLLFSLSADAAAAAFSATAFSATAFSAATSRSCCALSRASASAACSSSSF